MPKRNNKMEILLIPCITFRLKDDGSSVGRGFQKRIYDQIFSSAFIITNVGNLALWFYGFVVFGVLENIPIKPPFGLLLSFFAALKLIFRLV